MAKQIGNVVWTVGWDTKIFAWKSKEVSYIAEIENLHRDAIQSLHSVSTDNGWIVWTGSSDYTINVLFVPLEYDKGLEEEGKVT